MLLYPYQYPYVQQNEILTIPHGSFRTLERRRSQGLKKKKNFYHLKETKNAENDGQFGLKDALML